MEIIAILLGLALLWGYVAAAIYFTRRVWALMAARPEWLRMLACTAVLALFFAPGFVGAGHGAGLMPAWAVLVMPGANRFAIANALLALVVTWTMFVVIGVVARRIRKHPDNNN